MSQYQPLIARARRHERPRGRSGAASPDRVRAARRRARSRPVRRASPTPGSHGLRVSMTAHSAPRRSGNSWMIRRSERCAPKRFVAVTGAEAGTSAIAVAQSLRAARTGTSRGTRTPRAGTGGYETRIRRAAARAAPGREHTAARPRSVPGHDRRGDHDRDDGRRRSETSAASPSTTRDEIDTRAAAGRRRGASGARSARKAVGKEQPEHVPESRHRR